MDLQHHQDSSADLGDRVKLLTTKPSDLTIEVAANRLLLRGLLGWIGESDKRRPQLEAMLSRSIQSMMPQVLKLDGFPAGVQANARETLRGRAESLLADPAELEL